LNFRTKGQPGENTTLVVVATDATLTKAQTRRLAIMAQDGMARALRPIHTPLDGDIVFAAATCERQLRDPVHGLAELGALAADTVARAIARGVYEAKALPFAGAQPSWRDQFG
jgi:D-aminopeptidase